MRKRLSIVTGALLAIAAISSAAPAYGQSTAGADRMMVGIEGHYRVGCWTGVRRLDGQPIALIETRDGDGLSVQYEQPACAIWGYCVPGSEAVPLILRGPDEVVISARFPLSASAAQGASMIPRSMPWIVALGDPLGIDTIGANQILGRDASVAVSQPRSSESLPDLPLGYDGIDLVVIGRGGVDLLDAMSRQQREALAQWTTGGGNLFVTLGQSAPAILSAAPWLKRLLTLKQIDTVQMNPSALETFTSTQTPLQPFSGISLQKDRGRVLLMGRTQRRLSAPLAVRYHVGFGMITVVAADLEDAAFARWPERLDLILRLTGSTLQGDSLPRGIRNRATAYDDLAGQLRASLDRFSVQRRYNFSVVALILLALVAVIGPLDYWLINRLWGRPAFGWITFPLIIIALSAILILQSRVQSSIAKSAAPESIPPPRSQCNRLEIFDIDVDAGVGRGFVASYLYTHEARRVNASVAATEVLRQISDPVHQLTTVPLGTAGPAFGGIPIAMEDTRLPPYTIPLGMNDQTFLTSLEQLPMAARSSKGISASCRFRPVLNSAAAMRRRPGSELLQGELVNPLPVDLLDGILIYRNWAYLLPTRFPSGNRIASVASLRQKNFRWLLSRQQLLEQSETRTEAWDPARVDSLHRIAQMLMFFQAAGGASYTLLRNDPLADLDLSHVLVSDRCMLVGRLAAPLTEMELTNDDSTALRTDSDTLSLVRLVLKVQQNSPR